MGHTRGRRSAGLVWCVALALPVPVLFLADLCQPARWMRNCSRCGRWRSCPGWCCLRPAPGKAGPRAAHLAGYATVGLLALPWYLSLVRLLHALAGRAAG